MATRRTRSRRPARSRRAHKVNRQWTREEIAFMRKYYRGYETAWVARQLGRSVYSVRYKAVDLNLKKSRPSIWKGRTGEKNAYKGRKATSRKTVARRTASRRSSSRRRSYRATSSRRRMARRANSRRRSARR